ncbi:hypothetical protein [Nostoc sp. UHCC 0251]|uniref:hypothetical protein n=1 Tax=Nostoc sp. UHCC 0251 TaxID=3110240 RepID=UPI002B209241|nr:hypothetical protein [Nostoc sp. UHCC 0251]MEA5625199.1 hypothetical protein [Nostoc sp. UHCC 0251]
MRRLLANWVVWILAAPETNLFLFSFLFHFVYEVWQSPYFDFYQMPSLADKVNYITHCTVGDGIITVICYWLISWWCRRYWILRPTWKLTILFTGLGWLYTFSSEIYRVHIAKLYSVSALAVPGVGISWLPLLQWVILPPLVLSFARRYMLGYRNSS